MPLDEFWYGDLRLLEVYQKAYLRDCSYRAWVIGSNVNKALSKYFENDHSKKRTVSFEWEDYKDPIEKLFKPKTISKEQMEVEFRQRQAQDKAFVQKILHRS